MYYLQLFYCFVGWASSTNAFQITATPGIARRQQTTAASTTSKLSPTAITDCHLHGVTQFCLAGTDEYQILATPTQTTALPASYTGCHSHGSEIFCFVPDGSLDDEVQARPAGAEGATEGGSGQDQNHEGESGSSDEEENCHYHAGVKHCVGGSGESSAASCSAETRNYDINRRIGMLFAVLAASSIGVFGPIFIKKSFPHNIHFDSIFLVLKHFGTGVIISTAFVHLYTHASLTFASPCIGELAYEATVSAIFMAGLFLSFLVDYLGQRMVHARGERDGLHGDILAAYYAQKKEMVGLYVLEAGIIFHSIIIGVTTVMAPDGFFEILGIVIIFHQMFEGIALGTRIAAAGINTYGPPRESETKPRLTISLWKKLLMASAFAVITPVGMAIGIGVLQQFNGNDRATMLATGTLDAVSAGILSWVGIVEMLAADFMDGELASAGAGEVVMALGALVVGMGLMSFLGKWA